MERCVGVLAVLAVASAARSPSLPQVSWTVEDAVDLFNKGSNEDYIFKLVETDAEYVVISGDQSTRPHQMHFTVMETRCLVSENKNTQDCDFKKAGTMKACTAGLLVELDKNVIKINCDSLAPKRTRAGRSAAEWPGCRRPDCHSINSRDYFTTKPRRKIKKKKPTQAERHLEFHVLDYTLGADVNQ